MFKGFLLAVFCTLLCSWSVAQETGVEVGAEAIKDINRILNLEEQRQEQERREIRERQRTHTVIPSKKPPNMKRHPSPPDQDVWRDSNCQPVQYPSLWQGAYGKHAIINVRENSEVGIIRAGLCSVMLLLAGCGGGSSSSSSSGGGSSSGTPPPTYAIGGGVSGLAAGAELTVDIVGGSFTISTNGAVTFVDEFVSGESYNVTITAQPDGQICSVANGSGMIADADVTNIAITCESLYTVGGSVSGLASGKSMTIANAGENLTISTNGAVTFVDEFVSGESYNVTITAQPNGQICSVANGSGTITDADVTIIAITCEDLISISWEPSGHSSVNQSGGGYRVYYSETLGFAPGDPGVTVVDVPYTGSPVTSLKIAKPGNGTWYFRVQGYSDLGESVLSPETDLTIAE